MRASHVLVGSLEEANFIFDELQKGAEFVELAKKFSNCPSGKNGGDLGWFGKGQMVPEFEEAAVKLPVGGMDIVRSQFGFHVLKVTGKR